MGEDNLKIFSWKAVGYIDCGSDIHKQLHLIGQTKTEAAFISVEFRAISKNR